MFVVIIFHLFYVLVKFVLYLWWELNMKVIPVKYGRELTLTRYRLESNISTMESFFFIANKKVRNKFKKINSQIKKPHLKMIPIKDN